ncbi:histidine kinase [Olsenella sp. HMSC062G07]|uniref:GAF domain-containing sensor histidine kinase n=1 Tax=Olsenella sp. HMSC062G07 TaxID=1739330 RepID=UPI001FEED3A4|nr:histidine kinase [Olsenella sp. HMSC062G07]
MACAGWGVLVDFGWSAQKNQTRWAHVMRRWVGGALVLCSVVLLILLIEFFVGEPDPAPAVIIVSAIVPLCFFYAYVLVMPDDLTLTATDRTLQIASHLLAYAQHGLTPEMAQGICETILPETFASAICITDGRQMLASAGKNADHYPLGSPVSEATTRALESGSASIFQRDDLPPSDIFPLRAGIVVPLSVHTHVVGTIELYYTRVNQIDQRQIALSTGFGELLSSQLVSFELEQQAKRSMRMELSALQSQVDPHFLFNTISAIVSIVRVSPDRARSLLIDFSNYYRQTLGDSDELVKVSQEVEQGARYINLMQARYGAERLKVAMHIDDATRDLLVPPFIVQPILENSVKHGMREEEPLHVVVTSKVQEDRLTICVEDDGIGMSEDVRASLFDPERRPEGGEVEQHHQGCGLALCNVLARVRLSYGADSGIEVESQEGQGTRVTIFLVGSPTPSEGTARPLGQAS